MAPTFDTTPEKRATIRAMFKRQLFVEPSVVLKSEADLTGKTAIVTGSNTGIGFECAKQLLGLGLNKLIVAVRSETKGEEAKKLLLSESTAGKPIIEVWKLDLESYESVTSFVERAKTLERLDILVNNAAVTKKEFEINKFSGHEQSLQVNYLSVALMTILILPVLKEKNTPQQPGRIVIVNSDVSSWAKFKEQDSVPLLPAFDKQEFWDPNSDRYATSKLIGQLFISELCKRVPATVAVINAPNPGLCKSGLVREFKGTAKGFVFGIMERILARTSAVGARTLTNAAAKQGPDSHGAYIEDGKIQPWAPYVYQPKGQKVAERLWQETIDELAFAKVGDIIRDLSG